VEFYPKDLEYAAELLGTLAFDDEVRQSVIAGQRRRLQDFGDERIARDLASIVGGRPPKPGLPAGSQDPLRPGPASSLRPRPASSLRPPRS
jgi:hypothetical protein